MIDYAESRPDLRDRLKAVARLRAGKGSGRLRVVLVARNADDWWSNLLGSDAEVSTLLGDHAPWALPPLVTSEAERLTAFHEAVALFAIELFRATASASVCPNAFVSARPPPECSAEGGT